jgi:hypothetical protein
MVGVGALVINDKNQVLVVNERNALIPNSWKLPGKFRTLILSKNISIAQF